MRTLYSSPYHSLPDATPFARDEFRIIRCSVIYHRTARYRRYVQLTTSVVHLRYSARSTVDAKCN